MVDEEQAIRDQFWHPQPGEIVLDIGCYEGAYTWPALQAGAFVYAIDARAHVLAAMDDHPNLRKLHLAIYDENREYPAELVEAIQNGPHESSRDMIPDQDAKWVCVDHLNINNVDWIKIDVEGGELGVIQGAWATIAHDHPNLIIEDHTRVYEWVAGQDSRAKILSELAEQHYDPMLITDTYPDYIVAGRTE